MCSSAPGLAPLVEPAKLSGCRRCCTCRCVLRRCCCFCCLSPIITVIIYTIWSYLWLQNYIGKCGDGATVPWEDPSIFALNAEEPRAHYVALEVHESPHSHYTHQCC